MRIAIVHEWFTTIAGSEKVVEQILHLFPQADVFAVYADPVTVKTTKFLQGRRVVSSFIGKLPREDGAPYSFAASSPAERSGLLLAKHLC